MFNLPAPRAHPEPYDYGFNAAVMSFAKRHNPLGWLVKDNAADAPASLGDLQQVIGSLQGALPVYGGNSGQTVFGCPEHNIAFRAWHDRVHWLYGQEFNFAGEAATAYVQAWQIVHEYGDDIEVQSWVAMILVEVIGQALENTLRGGYIEDQRAFYNAQRARYFRLAGELCIRFTDETCGVEDAIALAQQTYGKGN